MHQLFVWHQRNGLQQLPLCHKRAVKNRQRPQPHGTRQSAHVRPPAHLAGINRNRRRPIIYLGSASSSLHHADGNQRRLCPSVCLCACLFVFLHDISKTDAARITNVFFRFFVWEQNYGGTQWHPSIFHRRNRILITKLTYEYKTYLCPVYVISISHRQPCFLGSAIDVCHTMRERETFYFRCT